jgi:hypothetical protein
MGERSAECEFNKKEKWVLWIKMRVGKGGGVGLGEEQKIAS